jgi:hypothetical protein
MTYRLGADIRQAGHARRRIVGVKRREDEMPGLRSLHRDLRGLGVTNLADQNDVGILAKNRPQCAGKRQLDLVVDLCLIDAGNLILDRIFDGDDVRPLRLHLRQRRAQRRRLPASGGTDHQNHAVLMAEEAAHLFQRRRRHPDLLEGGNALAVIEHAHDHLLAEERPQRGHTEVNIRAVFGGRAEAAVLRQPLLRDIHAGHDLQARNEALVDPFGQVHHFLEQSVEPVPDQHALLHGLDVDVARLALDRAPHHQIDQIDDGRRLTAFLEAGDRLEHLFFRAANERRLSGKDLPGPASRSRARGSDREVRTGLTDPGERPVRITGLDRLDDVTPGRDQLLDPVAGLELQILNQTEEQGV